MALRRVTRVELDGSTVMTSFGKRIVRAVKASYGDAVETATSTPMGMQGIRARTPGSYKVDQVKITFEFSVWRVQMLPNFPTTSATAIEMPIVVSFFHPEVGYDSDLLEFARFVGASQAVQNDNKAMEIETTWDINQIRWTTRRILLNSPQGLTLPPVGAF